MTIETIIRNRKTEKLLCDVDAHQTVPADIAAKNKEIMLQAINTAGWAPFHFPRNVDDIAEPWRAHILWPEDVKKTALYLRDQLNVTTKEPNIVAACSALVLVTWLPEFHDLILDADSPAIRESQLVRDEEHLAATSALVQNLLLILGSHNMATYWSSGGKLRQAEMFDYLGIPADERLLGAVFVEYPEMRDESKIRKEGKHRHSRCEDWINEISI